MDSVTSISEIHEEEEQSWRKGHEFNSEHVKFEEPVGHPSGF